MDVINQTKVCALCHVEKELKKFSKQRRQCNDCRYKKSREAKADRMVEINAKRRQNRELEKDKINARSRELKAKNREHVNEVKRNWASNNREKCSALNARWRAENKAWITAYRTEYYLNRKRTDPEFKLLCNLRTRLRDALNGKNKSASTLELLGCDTDFLRDYLEAEFTPEMSWDNYGSHWHIDHIRPCASFDLTDPEEQRKCFHWSNLQPLPAQENLRKGAKLNWHSEC